MCACVCTLRRVFNGKHAGVAAAAAVAAHGGTKQSLLNGFLKRRKRDIALVVLTIIVLVSASLLWPILFSLRVDGTTSMSWAAVWTPLWISDGIGKIRQCRTRALFSTCRQKQCFDARSPQECQDGISCVASNHNAVSWFLLFGGLFLDTFFQIFPHHGG